MRIVSNPYRIEKSLNGLPGLKSFAPFDPLYVKRVAIAEDGNSPVSLNIELTNVEMTGLKDTSFLDASYEHAKGVTKLQMSIPTLNMNSDCDLKGRVLSLPLNG
ncbi:uncharacterized protein LOC142231325 [Haematobia irritans]|uniref:uncharacterized protein LOC142231325 n=1 Tax=Haematobia irritans TaxID=7368 RepID=UPI003F4FA56A